MRPSSALALGIKGKQWRDYKAVPKRTTGAVINTANFAFSCKNWNIEYLE